MKVLVVGNGAREHAIAKALADSTTEPKLYAFMSAMNPGIKKLTKAHGIGDTCNPSEVAGYAQEKGVEIAVVGPEAPLAAGVADALEQKGIKCVGPMKYPAQLETDKSFCRTLMQKYGVGGLPDFGIFKDAADACDYIDECAGDLAVKPAGLTGGKGVKIMGEHFTADGAKEYVREILDSGLGRIPRVVLEERLVGEEFTLQAFVDGKHVVGAPMVQDHKRAYEGDVGPNTGGMGSYSDAGYILPFLTKTDYDSGLRMMKDTVKAVAQETGQEYRGFLYGQFMATAEGVKVIEYNVRLGDPEAMNILSILDSDMVGLCADITSGSLRKTVRFQGKATVCKYMVPEGYPEKPLNNVQVKIDEKKMGDIGGLVYYASVREEEGKILTSKSRAVAVVGVDDTIAAAEKVAQKCMAHIKGRLRYRGDIGTKELIDRRFKHMKELRGLE
jgi:phosphoribosylamine--glycine ligase